jgi:hypothetical protein
MFNALATIFGIALIGFVIDIVDRLSRCHDRERHSRDTAA